jgi:hypothetical protein
MDFQLEKDRRGNYERQGVSHKLKNHWDCEFAQVVRWINDQLFHDDVDRYQNFKCVERKVILRLLVALEEVALAKRDVLLAVLVDVDRVHGEVMIEQQVDYACEDVHIEGGDLDVDPGFLETDFAFLSAVVILRVVTCQLVVQLNELAVHHDIEVDRDSKQVHKLSPLVELEILGSLGQEGENGIGQVATESNDKEHRFIIVLSAPGVAVHV